MGIAVGTAIDIDANSTSGELCSDVALSDSPDGGEGSEALIRVRTVNGDVRVFRAQRNAVSVV